MLNKYSCALAAILLCTPASAEPARQQQVKDNLAAWQEMVDNNMKLWREATETSAPATRTQAKVTFNCQVSGKTKGLDSALKKRLCGMSQELGAVTVVSGCRSHGSKRAPDSYHKVSRGCKAADVQISGVKGSEIIRHWAKNGGGGIGTYKGKRFVHVDVGTTRSWRW